MQVKSNEGCGWNSAASVQEEMPCAGCSAWAPGACFFHLPSTAVLAPPPPPARLISVASREHGTDGVYRATEGLVFLKYERGGGPKGHLVQMSSHDGICCAWVGRSFLG